MVRLGLFIDSAIKYNRRLKLNIKEIPVIKLPINASKEIKKFNKKISLMSL